MAQWRPAAAPVEAAQAGRELLVRAALTRSGRLSLPPPAAALLREPHSRWRLQLLEWDGLSAEAHRAEFRRSLTAKLPFVRQPLTPFTYPAPSC